MVTIRITIRISVNESERVREGAGSLFERGERNERRGETRGFPASDKGRLWRVENLVKRGRPASFTANATRMHFPCISAFAALRASMLPAIAIPARFQSYEKKKRLEISKKLHRKQECEATLSRMKLYHFGFLLDLRAKEDRNVCVYVCKNLLFNNFNTRIVNRGGS